MSAYHGAITLDGGTGGGDNIKIESSLDLGSNNLTVTSELMSIGDNAEVTTSTGSQTYNGPLTLGLNGPAALSTTGSGTIILGGNVASYFDVGNAIGPGNLDLGGVVRTFAVRDATASPATDLLISAVISNGSLLKSAPGTLTLSGASTYSGSTAVQDGTLQLAGGVNRLPLATILTLGSGTTGGILDLNNQNQQLAGLINSGTGVNRIIDSASDATTPVLTVVSPLTPASTSLQAILADTVVGEGSYTYAWSVASKPAGAADPQFSANGINAAKSVTATFFQAGDYSLTLTIDNAGAPVATSTVLVSVSQVPTSVSITPAGVSILRNASQQYVATANDQFGQPLAVQPIFTWSMVSGPGTISASGNYTASLISGPYTVQATSGAISGTASGTILNSAPTVALPAAANPSSVVGVTTMLTVLGADDGGEASLTYVWSALAKPAGAADPTLSVNGTNGAKNGTATFSQSGNYQFRVTISDGSLSATSDVAVTVDITPAQNHDNQFDVNGDGIVNIVDLIDLIDLIVLHGIGPAPIPLPTDNPKLYPDVNGDRTMNLLDLIDVIFYVVDPPPPPPLVSPLIGPTPASAAPAGERQADHAASTDEFFARSESESDCALPGDLLPELLSSTQPVSKRRR